MLPYIEISPRYFLKRWRKDAKLVTMDEADGFSFDSDTNSCVPGCYAEQLTHMAQND
jgi:hypothetical protein